MSKELEFAGENLEHPALWQPDITLRPHHFWQEDVQNTLLKQHDPFACAEVNTNYYSAKKKTSDPSGYWGDLVGKGSKDRKGRIQSMVNFYVRLHNLPDSSVVHLDLKPDGICESCPIGKHCKATNYESTSSPRDIAELETKNVMNIAFTLQNSGFAFEKDFIMRRTTHTLNDFQGNKLNSSVKTIPRVVEFQSFLVKLGALRTIVSNSNTKDLL